MTSMTAPFGGSRSAAGWPCRLRAVARRRAGAGSPARLPRWGPRAAAETDRAAVGGVRAVRKRRSLHAGVATAARPESEAASAGRPPVAWERVVATRPPADEAALHGLVRTAPVRAPDPEGSPESSDRRRSIVSADHRPRLIRYTDNCMALRRELELKRHTVSWFNASLVVLPASCSTTKALHW